MKDQKKIPVSFSRAGNLFRLCLFCFIGVSLPLSGQSTQRPAQKKIVHKKTVIDSFLGETIERLAMIREYEDIFQSFIFNQHYFLHGPVSTYFTIDGNHSFEELYIRTSKYGIITILPSTANNFTVGDFSHTEHIFIVYPEQLNEILANNTDTPARIVYYDEIRGSLSVDFTIPLEFWKNVREMNLQVKRRKN